MSKYTRVITGARMGRRVIHFLERKRVLKSVYLFTTCSFLQYVLIDIVCPLPLLLLLLLCLFKEITTTAQPFLNPSSRRSISSCIDRQTGKVNDGEGDDDGGIQGTVLNSPPSLLEKSFV